MNRTETLAKLDVVEEALMVVLERGEGSREDDLNTIRLLLKIQKSRALLMGVA